MERIDFLVTVEKLYLIARSLDSLLMDDYSILTHGTDLARKCLLNVIIAGVSELHHSLEALAMADPKDFDKD